MKTVEKNEKVEILVLGDFFMFFRISEFRYPSFLRVPDSMTQAVQVPARESDRKSIVSPSSEGAEWATGARIYYSNVPGTRGGEIFALRRLWRSVPAPFRFFCKLRQSRGLSSPTEHLSVCSESCPPLYFCKVVKKTQPGL